MERTAFVTGGSGLVDRRTVDQAAGRRWRTIRALAPSERSARAVEALGAKPVRGDLEPVVSAKKDWRSCE